MFDFGFCREMPAPSTSVSKPRSAKSSKKEGGADGEEPELENPSSLTEEDEEDKQFVMSGKGTLL